MRLKKKTRDAAYNHIGLVWCGLWCLTPLSTIFSYIVAVSFIGGENRSTRGKSVASHRQTLSHNVQIYRVHPAMNGVRTFNVSGDRH